MASAFEYIGNLFPSQVLLDYMSRNHEGFHDPDDFGLRPEVENSDRFASMTRQETDIFNQFQCTGGTVACYQVDPHTDDAFGGVHGILWLIETDSEPYVYDQEKQIDLEVGDIVLLKFDQEHALRFRDEEPYHYAKFVNFDYPFSSVTESDLIEHIRKYL